MRIVEDSGISLSAKEIRLIKAWRVQSEEIQEMTLRVLETRAAKRVLKQTPTLRLISVGRGKA